MQQVHISKMTGKLDGFKRLLMTTATNNTSKVNKTARTFVVIATVMQC